MFRDLVRKHQQLREEECKELLATEKRGVLSVQGEDGYPYGMPMNFYYCEDDGRIYFHSGKRGHKIDALRACDKVSFCVYDEGVPKEEGAWALLVKSVIVFGRVELVEDAAVVEEMSRRLSYRFTDDAAYIEGEIAKSAKATVMLVLTPEHMCGKRVKEE